MILINGVLSGYIQFETTFWGVSCLPLWQLPFTSPSLLIEPRCLSLKSSSFMHCQILDEHFLIILRRLLAVNSWQHGAMIVIASRCGISFDYSYILYFACGWSCLVKLCKLPHHQKSFLWEIVMLWLHSQCMVTRMVNDIYLILAVCYWQWLMQLILLLRCRRSSSPLCFVMPHFSTTLQTNCSFMFCTVRLGRLIVGHFCFCFCVHNKSIFSHIQQNK